MMHGVFGWETAHRSDTGKERSVNEDAFLDAPAQGLVAVADGMGGHAAGDIASEMVVEALRTVEPSHSLGVLVNEARTRLQQVNQQLLKYALENGESIIGSTVVALLTSGDYGTYLWAGDSRIYLFRRGSLRQLTRDHSQVEELLEKGVISPSQAKNHPASNVITKAVGADRQLLLDAEIIEIMAGDIFLLCSDGLYREVDETEIAAILDQNSVSEAADRLMELALERGAHDNVTFVIARVRGGMGAES